MSNNVKAIITDAKARAVAANHKEENLFVMLGTIPGDTPGLLEFKRGVVTLDSKSVNEARKRGEKIFKKFKKYLKKAVCDDFHYCRKRDEVKQALDKYLPEIVKAILKRLPIRGKLPAWLAKLLGAFGIAASSTQVLVTMFVAWIIIKGCDELCGCAD